jgi:uncharacterized membrane protein YedE/YeeE
MLAIAMALASGILFGLGLIVSQMVNPAKILSFLDVFGSWDPSLALVMVGAIPVAAIGFAFTGRMRQPLAAPTFRLPQQTRLDRDLLLGAALFGIGWGAVGYCPGPAIVSLGMGQPAAVPFVLAMLAGMGLYEVIQLVTRRKSMPEA